MSFKVALIGVITVSLLPAMLSGEGLSDVRESDPNKEAAAKVPMLFGGPRLGSLGLLEPERFSMSQRYILGFSSDGRSGHMQGMYLNTIRYRFARPLTLQLRLGYVGSSTLFGAGYGSDPGEFFIPEFELRYQPSRNLLFTVRYLSFPPGTFVVSPWAY